MSITDIPIIIPQNVDQAIQRDQAAGLTDPALNETVIAEKGPVKLTTTPTGVLVVWRHHQHVHLTPEELTWAHRTATEHQASLEDSE